MKITLITVGKKMPDWVTTGFQDYQKRLPPECALLLKEIDALKRSKHSDLERIKEQEGELLLSKVPKGDKLIALDAKGKHLDTLELSQTLRGWQHDGRNISLLIGGPEGLSKNCLKTAETHWSLSRLTLPHPLVRIITAEQLYRAWSVLQNHPYHR